MLASSTMKERWKHLYPQKQTPGTQTLRSIPFTFQTLNAQFIYKAIRFYFWVKSLVNKLVQIHITETDIQFGSSIALWKKHQTPLLKESYSRNAFGNKKIFKRYSKKFSID